MQSSSNGSNVKNGMLMILVPNNGQRSGARNLERLQQNTFLMQMRLGCCIVKHFLMAENHSKEQKHLGLKFSKKLDTLIDKGNPAQGFESLRS